MVQSNHRGSSATGKRGGARVSSGEKQVWWGWNRMQRQTEEAEQRRTERERENLEKCHSPCPCCWSHFTVLVFCQFMIRWFVLICTTAIKKNNYFAHSVSDSPNKPIQQVLTCIFSYRIFQRWKQYLTPLLKRNCIQQVLHFVNTEQNRIQTNKLRTTKLRKVFLFKSETKSLLLILSLDWLNMCCILSLNKTKGIREKCLYVSTYLQYVSIKS